MNDKLRDYSCQKQEWQKILIVANLKTLRNNSLNFEHNLLMGLKEVSRASRTIVLSLFSTWIVAFSFFNSQKQDRIRINKDRKILSYIKIKDNILKYII